MFGTRIQPTTKALELLASAGILPELEKRIRGYDFGKPFVFDGHVFDGYGNQERDFFDAVLPAVRCGEFSESLLGSREDNWDLNNSIFVYFFSELANERMNRSGTRDHHTWGSGNYRFYVFNVDRNLVIERMNVSSSVYTGLDMQQEEDRRRSRVFDTDWADWHRLVAFQFKWARQSGRLDEFLDIFRSGRFSQPADLEKMRREGYPNTDELVLEVNGYPGNKTPGIFQKDMPLVIPGGHHPFEDFYHYGFYGFTGKMTGTHLPFVPYLREVSGELQMGIGIMQRDANKGRHYGELKGRGRPLFTIVQKGGGPIVCEQMRFRQEDMVGLARASSKCYNGWQGHVEVLMDAIQKS